MAFVTPLPAISWPSVLESPAIARPLIAVPSVPLPRWLVVGAVAGLLSSLCVAATFLVATRVFPDHADPRRGTRRSTESRRRAEIRRYLGTLGERYREDASLDGRDVAFYLPDRDVAVTFDARTFLALEGTDTHTVLAEHELPGAALGGRFPFETPTVTDESTGAGSETARNDSRTASNSGAAASAYAVLGLSSDAGEEAIRRAYRERIKEVHPDRGGTEAEFLEVREAYDTARRSTR